MANKEIELLDHNGKTDSGVMNPFPGLRPFTINESHLFFGREGQIDEVVSKLSRNRFAAIVGVSGSGKSSLMYCGLIPKLHGGLFVGANSDWEVIITRPGSSPMQNLADSLNAAEANFSNGLEENKAFKRIFTQSILKSSSLGLIDAIKQLIPLNRNIFLLIDQFEELFRYKNSEGSHTAMNEVAGYVNLLIESIRQNEVPLYIALTIRSDFTGNFAQFPELTKMINKSHYLIPQMNREQRKAAIEGPVAVGGGKITPRLIRQVLNDIGDNQDQLPIMQHALMRTWSHWSETKNTEEPIDIKHYYAIGTVEGALSEHANEAYDELSESQKDICEVLFKTITEKGNDESGVRSPTRLDVIAAIGGFKVEDVQEVIEHFRKPERSLLMPPVGVSLEPRSIIDVSHESLIRIWTRLRRWVEEEYEAVQMYLRLCEAAEKYQAGLTTLWRPPDLQLALDWKQKQKPTLVWAQQYDPAFERAMVFLKSSEEAHELEQKNKEALQQRRLRTSKIVALIFGIVMIFSFLLMIYGFSKKLEADEGRAEIIRQNNELQLQNAKIIEQRNESDSLRQLEKEARDLAEQRKDEAERERHNAQESALLAREQANIAEERRQEADSARIYAESQEQKAKESEQEAKEQRAIAEDNSNEAYRLRILSIAKTMAVKSLQIDDGNLKGLLSLQAFQFNENYKGYHLDYDMYAGLYSAYKKLKGDSINRLIGHNGSVRSMVFHPDGKILFTTSGDGRILKWNLEGDDGAHEEIIDNGRNNLSNRVLAISPDGKWLVSGHDADYLELFDLTDKKKKPIQLDAHDSRIWDIEYLPDNRGFISAGADSTVQFYNHKDFRLITKTNSRVNDIAASPDGETIVLAKDNGELEKVNLTTGEKVIIYYNTLQNSFESVTFSHNGDLVAFGERSGLVKILELKNNRLKANLSGFKARVSSIAFGPNDESLAATSFDGEGRIWNMAKLNNQPIVLYDHEDWVWSLTFSPDGTKLVTGSANGLIRMYPTDPRELAEQICPHLIQNFSTRQWYQYVDTDIKYEQTCPDLPIGDNELIK
ncbi:hypothetical protein QQ008_28345 [Fulvivirgaceae bacterium BMA10]|uniref:Novel STAND NTPase 1 domain-containing protein n=1 Tax=Splendidivirga corallicola TaxID=3051826 RepID=A0ABT8KYZ1_9BACT|nr:hypothetical protein [Fulvivirgaceae bacterium BMA10]